MNWRRRLIGATIMAGIVALMLGGRYVGLPYVLVHEKGTSMPRGFYVWSGRGRAAAVGDVVLVEREAVPTPPGTIWGLPYLMKRVVAVGGDAFCWDGTTRHFVNSQPQPPVAPAVAAAAGVEPWRGCAVLEPDEIAAYGDGVASYDSRYIGPVKRADLIGRYVMIWADQNAAAPEGLRRLSE